MAHWENNQGYSIKRQVFYKTLCGLLLMAVLSSCSALKSPAQSDLGRLQQALQQEFHEPNVGLTVSNGDMLMVSFVNSAFNRLAPNEQQQKAHDIALFITQNYRSILQVRQIWISFVIHRSLFNVFNYTNSLDTFMYDRRELLPDVYPPTSDGFKTVFIIKPYAANTVKTLSNLSPVGPMLVAGGILWLLFAVFIAWKTKRRAFLILGAGSILFFCFGVPFTLGLSGAQQSRSEEYQRLNRLYDQQQYQIAEGTVHVLHEQPRSGHAEGDIITLGSTQFTVDYYAEQLGYDQTIAWGGALSEGTYARVYYDGDTIFRVDIKSP